MPHYSVLDERWRKEGSGTVSHTSLPRQLSYTQDGRHLGSGCGLLGTVRRFPDRDQGKGPSTGTQLGAFSKARKPPSGSSLDNPRQGRKCTVWEAAGALSGLCPVSELVSVRRRVSQEGANSPHNVGDTASQMNEPHRPWSSPPH